MTIKPKPTITAFLTTIALAGLPPAALASGNPHMAHHHHARHTSVRYVLGNNWNTTNNRPHGHRSRLHSIDYGRNWS